MINIEINQSLLKGKKIFGAPEINKIARLTAGATNTKKKWNVSLAIVNQTEMRKLNRSYRGKNKATDVLSFAYKQGDLLGEVAICHTVAVAEARKKKITINEELRMLLAHGLLHLLGYDHERIGDEKKMFQIQNKILKKYDGAT